MICAKTIAKGINFKNIVSFCEMVLTQGNLHCKESTYPQHQRNCTYYCIYTVLGYHKHNIIHHLRWNNFDICAHNYNLG